MGGASVPRPVRSQSRTYLTRTHMAICVCSSGETPRATRLRVRETNSFSQWTCNVLNIIV